MGAAKGNKNAVGNPGGGRPTLYKQEYNKIAYQLALLGATDEEIADAFDVGRTTIHEWKNKHIEFYEHLKRGKLQADAKVSESLYHRALGYTHNEDKIFQYEGKPITVKTKKHYPPDPTSAIFWLKNRRSDQWRDSKNIDHTSNGQTILNTSVDSIKEKDELDKLSE